jgi:N-carbamoylputrescine amidase
VATDMRTLRVAAVQLGCDLNAPDRNLDHAIPFIEQAASDGAQLVVLPELFACGYVPNQRIWDLAEPCDGRTLEWLAQAAGRLHVHLGVGLAETDGQDFFNVYLICAPDGRLAGRVRKTKAEASIFRSAAGTHAVDTALGKIGVGICADNQFTFLPKLLQAQAIDLHLMPHAWPAPVKPGGLVSEADIRAQQARAEALPVLYASLLGVPVVFVNQVGRFEPMDGILGRLMEPAVYRLQGRSRIVDSDGVVKAELGSEAEGVIVADVTLELQRRPRLEPHDYDGWLQPGPALVRKGVIPLDEWWGRRSYGRSAVRREKARQGLIGRG